MAQGDLTLFNELSTDLLEKVHNLGVGDDDIKVMLIDNTTVATAASSAVKATFTEVTGGTYAAVSIGGANQSVSNVSGSTYKYDSVLNPSWSQDGSGPTNIYQAVIFNETATSDECIGFIDMTTDGGTTPISLQAGNVSITWNASGIFTLG